MAEQKPLGLIAGSGGLPELVARGAKAAGREVVCVGLKGSYEDSLPGLCDRFAPAGMIRLGQWIRLMNRWGAGEAIMVGGVKKTTMYKNPLAVFSQAPDWRAMHLWFRKLRHDRRDQMVLAAVADELQRNGVTLIDSTTFIPDHLATAGPMTQREPTAREWADIRFGWPMLMSLASQDIGQALAVKDRDVIAVEAMEGTARMIERAGELCRRGGWVLLKGADDAKDRRFDVPTVGIQTIEALSRLKASCLALRPGAVIMVDKPKVLEAADAAGIAVIGVEPAVLGEA